jgi:plastocyanin
MKTVLLLSLLFPLCAIAADADYKIVIRDHHFYPAELTVVAGKKLTLLIENQDATVEEFDSDDLSREQRIKGHGSITLYLGPLEPGSYAYAGELHKATAQGVIVAK